MRERTETAIVRWTTQAAHPNGLHAAPDALWIIDQKDGRLYHQAYDDGRVLRVIETEADRASGVTWDGSHVWLASTYNCKLLQVDPASGRTVAELDTPGAGVVPWGKPGQPRTGAHGLEWRDGTLWVAVPPSGTIYQVNPDNGAVLQSFKGPGFRPHGLAWQGDDLWCVETNDRAFYRYRIDTGDVLERIVIDGPEPHGMTIHQGQFWYCQDVTREIATVKVPAS